MKNLNKSFYNVVNSQGDVTFVYNTLTAAFLRVPSVKWESLSENSDKDFLCMLKKQGILVTDHQTEINKYKYFFYKNAFDNLTVDLTIAPTMQCNFNCPYCFEGDNKTFSKMPTEVESAIVKYIIKKSQHQQINICWFGGEPMLAFDIITSISSRLDSENVKFKAHIITNGSLLTEERVLKFPLLHLTHIQISLDGVAEEHDKTRKYKSGKPSFKDIMQGIDLVLSKTDIVISLRVGVDNTHLMSYRDVYDYMHQKYPKEISDKRLLISANIIQNRTNFDKNDVCLSNQQLFAKKAFDLKKGKNDYFRPSLPGLSLPCMYKSASSLAIDSQGFIYPCLEFLGDITKSIGNIITGEIAFSKRSNLLFNNSAFDDEECLKCCVFPICCGGCPKDRDLYKSNKKVYCSFYKQYLKELLPLFSN